MAFVKLDTGILDSTLWIERECREVFITALLLAHPFDTDTPMDQYEVRTLKKTGFTVPAGWYGFVPAAGAGIVRRAMVDNEAGLVALEKLGNPDLESRSRDFDGRRMVRVDGGYIVLNFMKYRDRDHTTAARSKRYRDRQSHRDLVVTHRDNTQAEAEADAKKARAGRGTRLPADWKPTAELEAWARSARPDLDLQAVLDRFRDFFAAAPSQRGVKLDWPATYRNWVRKEDPPRGARPAQPATPTRECSVCHQRVTSWTSDKCNPCWRASQGLEPRK